jgi:AcrR family transcriptional regulator
LPKPVSPPPQPAPTRERIRAIAGDLYVRRGHDGFSFGDIAEVIGTTRANIHHHFGNKQNLMTELIDGFAADAQARIEQHWSRPGLTFSERLAAQLDDLRRFHHRFNPASGDRNVWSPVSRLRLDLPILGTPAVEALERVNRIYDSCLRQALSEAVAAGEIAPAAPVEEIARLLRVTLLSCPPMTQDSGSFTEIEELFWAVERILAAAWGADGLARKLREDFKS